ncbi:hypothetical protein [Tepidibacter mesophilus]|uniref:hypothetical protein n=1 Tax=Tepidibacter mesophilus TaxID=655607 RepID=UPI000C075151|nr:hypothetical protein [Tepidibacter mesophilus]
MKKIISIILIAICSIVFFIGCNKSDVDKSEHNVVVSDSNDNENSSDGSGRESRYDVAGIDNPAEFEEMFNEVKRLVFKGDKNKVSEYVIYPLKVNHDGSTREIATEDEFIKNYDNIFTERVKEALSNQDVKDTFINYQGVMVGDGEVWFGASRGLPKYGIIAINN